MRAEAALDAERTSLARRVEERTAQLAQASRLKDEFLASMSHELRTPLNAILGLSEALQEQVYGPLNDKQLKTLNIIEESGRHLLALINDILDVSKIEAGKLTLQEEWISVEEICQASLRLIRQAAQKKMLKIAYTLDKEVNTIYADQRRLKQILVNLLSNAVKFTPNGETIGLEVKHDPINQATLFNVWDTGIGIAPEDINRLFQPFVQIDSSLARQHSGTGLGLALVRRLTELHGGQVWLESQPGQGSRFTVSLPWSELYKTLEEITTDKMELGDQSRRLLRRALIVEDSTATVDQVVRYLAELGLETFVHHQAEGVLAKIQAVRPDVIILDILLPDLSGWEVLKRLKQDASARSIPVIIVSVIDEPAQKSTLDVVEYLVKPVSRQQLQASLLKILASKESEGMVLVSSEPSRILLVEDNLNNIETISEYLVNKGYHIIVAHNGQEALERARADCPDLILMDIQMPGMDGLEAIRRIRADKTQSVATVSIIALTALSMPGDRERCLQAGANEYLSKPISLKELAKVIEKQLT
jgi:CheY-like chemotaxis protein/nitrogen-specific signal transduction histidine kinase